ncbi:MAG TPA: hypothetical protein GX511_01815, partial [Firmicutes bacterium]|nr:hypothetical protein [Bacillota bacterium]
TQERLGATVWTFSPGAVSGAAWEDGVRYQRLALTPAGEAPHLALVTLNGAKATYTGLKL